MTLARKKARRSVPRRITPEASVMLAVGQFLSVHRIWWMRQQYYKGPVKSGRWMHTGESGMGDILAFPRVKYELKDGTVVSRPMPMWIECKSAKGRQEFSQTVFQQIAIGENHWYVVVKDSYELEAFLKKRGVI